MPTSPSQVMADGAAIYKSRAASRTAEIRGLHEQLATRAAAFGADGSDSATPDASALWSQIRGLEAERQWALDQFSRVVGEPAGGPRATELLRTLEGPTPAEITASRTSPTPLTSPRRPLPPTHRTHRGQAS